MLRAAHLPAGLVAAAKLLCSPPNPPSLEGQPPGAQSGLQRSCELWKLHPPSSHPHPQKVMSQVRVVELSRKAQLGDQTPPIIPGAEGGQRLF